MISRMNPKPENIIDQVLIDEDKVRAMAREIAGQLQDIYKDTLKVTVLSVLSGAVYFTQLLRQTGLLDEKKFNFQSISAASYYHSTQSSGKVNIDLLDTPVHIRFHSVLILDDIYDTGNTLCEIINAIKPHKPADIRVCVMLQRQGPHTRKVPIHHVGAYIPKDGFVIGCGLDYQDNFRDLPYIATIKPEFCDLPDEPETEK